MGSDQPALVRCGDCDKVLTGRLDDGGEAKLSSGRSCPTCGGESFEAVEEGVHEVDASPDGGTDASGSTVD
ncbi:Zn-ribbon domain-containing protein [Halomarina salina]|uniref:Zn-ribbon domain-containing protein n=1 Tax=Halomarina salina TaxID=1872699 RepID=A0ABD5RQQ3_9EURY|nr:Zn-ribbon domain-containing protein [Halomarina salina]